MTALQVNFGPSQHLNFAELLLEATVLSETSIGAYRASAMPSFPTPIIILLLFMYVTWTRIINS